MTKPQHIPVLLHEIIENAELRDDMTIVDMTLGRGGHSKAVLESGFQHLTLVGLDADEVAIKESRELLEPIAQQTHASLVFENCFNDHVTDALNRHEIDAVDLFLFDLGISSPHVDSSGRGFTFQKDEPLKMTMSENGELTAEEIVNTWSEESLADIIYGYGEERYTRRIAKKIVETRDTQPITTTTQLVDLIMQAVPASYRHGKIHPATRTFQALRITTNDELERLKRSLRQAITFLKPEGRILVISFHSLEDRIVKRLFKEWEEQSVGKRITKKPIVPTQEEIITNPRSRSAKLRIFTKAL